MRLRGVSPGCPSLLLPLVWTCLDSSLPAPTPYSGLFHAWLACGALGYFCNLVAVGGGSWSCDSEATPSYRVVARAYPSLGMVQGACGVWVSLAVH
uniref:Uncharacterized protein n=1 Tax=Ixodes ricinus TaxID=34613 RepID=A0A6B0UD82_IXORI